MSVPTPHTPTAVSSPARSLLLSARLKRRSHSTRLNVSHLYRSITRPVVPAECEIEVLCFWKLCKSGLGLHWKLDTGVGVEHLGSCCVRRAFSHYCSNCVHRGLLEILYVAVGCKKGNLLTILIHTEIYFRVICQHMEAHRRSGF